ncbi:MAG: D-glycerate dehydrogenase [bacterium]|nr:D-glycerate dehydrogenase [bacterium]
MKWNVFVTREIPRAGIDLLRENGCRVDINPEDRPLTRDELVAAVSGRDGFLAMITDTLDREALERMKGIRVLSNCAAGYNHIDLETATRMGILVTNTPGVLTDATADLTWALMFAVSRRIVEADRFTRAGRFREWHPMGFLGGDLTGRTLGIVGAGRIGRAVALRSSGFGMTVLYADGSAVPELEAKLGARRVGLDELLALSDFVSLHVPLTPETRRLIDSRALGLMKRSAYLINTSRGPVVDEKALVEALRSGRIAGAGLDVYENEPEIESGLIGLDNVVLLPHIGSATLETRTRMSVMAAENLLEGLSGKKPKHLVNPEAWKPGTAG